MSSIPSRRLPAAAVEALAAHFRYPPYHYYRSLLGAQKLKRNFRHYLDSLGDNLNIGGAPGCRYAFAVTGLDWDSKQIGMRAGRVDLVWGQNRAGLQRAVEEALQTALDCSIRHLTIRISAEDTEACHILETAGFQAMDTILSFSKRLAEPAKYSVAESRIRIARRTDIRRARAIAGTIYELDRFHVDPLIPQRAADVMYANWIENSIGGQVADRVFIAERKGRIAGFVTCKLDRASSQVLQTPIGAIVLLGVAKALQGQGIGSSLIRAALGWFGRQGVVLVEIGTQLRNLRAANLYWRSGFTLAAASMSMRKIM